MDNKFGPPDNDSPPNTPPSHMEFGSTLSPSSPFNSFSSLAQLFNFSLTPSLSAAAAAAAGGGMVSMFSFENFPFGLRHRRQIFSSLAAATAMLILGSIIGWSSTALPSLKQSAFPELRPDQESWIGSIVPLAALIAGPIFGASVDHLGRKPTMILTGLLSILAWLIIAFASTVEHLYFGRFISGLCVGSFALVIPIYVSDITEKELRGTLSTVVQLSTSLGIFFCWVLGTIANWQWSALLLNGFSFLFLVLILFVPESPRYCLDVGRKDDAQRILCWLRGADSVEDVKPELESMAQSLAELKAQTRSLRQIFLSSRIRIPLLTMLILMIIQQLTGINAMLYYMVEIFEETGSTHAYMNSIIIGVVSPVFIILATTLMDVIGRKPLLIYSAAFSALAHFINGTYLFLRYQGYSLNIFAWLPLSSFILFFGAFAVGLGPVPWVIMSEILPNHVIGFASGLTVTTHFFCAFLTTRYFYTLSQWIGMDWTFYFCSLWAAIGVAFVAYFVPETKLKTLEEIQEFFRERAPSLGGLLNNDDEEEEEAGEEGPEGDGGRAGGTVNNNQGATYNTFDNKVDTSETEF